MARWCLVATALCGQLAAYIVVTRIANRSRQRKTPEIRAVRGEEDDLHEDHNNANVDNAGPDVLPRAAAAAEARIAQFNGGVNDGVQPRENVVVVNVAAAAAEHNDDGGPREDDGNNRPADVARGEQDGAEGEDDEHVDPAVVMSASSACRAMARHASVAGAAAIAAQEKSRAKTVRRRAAVAGAASAVAAHITARRRDDDRAAQPAEANTSDRRVSGEESGPRSLASRMVSRRRDRLATVLAAWKAFATTTEAATGSSGAGKREGASPSVANTASTASGTNSTNGDGGDDGSSADTAGNNLDMLASAAGESHDKSEQGGARTVSSSGHMKCEMSSVSGMIRTHSGRRRSSACVDPVGARSSSNSHVIAEEKQDESIAEVLLNASTPAATGSGAKESGSSALPADGRYASPSVSMRKAQATADSATEGRGVSGVAKCSSVMDDKGGVSRAISRSGSAGDDSVSSSAGVESPLIEYGVGGGRAIAAPFLHRLRANGADFLLTICDAMRGNDKRARVRASTLAEGGCATVHVLETLKNMTPNICAVTGGFGCVVKLPRKDLTGQIAKVAEAGFLREIKTLKRIPLGGHENIVAAFCISAPERMIVMQRCGTDLWKLLRDCTTPPTRASCVSYARQIVRGVRYIHAQSIIHGDLKLDNVLLDPTSRIAMICDFGMSGDVGAQVIGGSLPYLPAEVLALRKAGGARLDFPLDSFSIGVMLQQLLAGSAEGITFPSVAMKYMLYPPGYGGQFLKALDHHIEELLHTFSHTMDPRDEAKLSTAHDFKLYLFDAKVAIWLRMGDLESTLLSSTVWPAREALRYPAEVVGVVKKLLHKDPEKRLSLQQLERLLSYDRLWEDVDDPAAPSEEALPRHLRVILDEIHDDNLREQMLEEGEGRPAWLENVVQHWWEYPDISAVRRSTQR